jgi:hypothetical protein
VTRETLRWSSCNNSAATAAFSGNTASRGYCANACCASSSADHDVGGWVPATGHLYRADPEGREASPARLDVSTLDGTSYHQIRRYEIVPVGSKNGDHCNQIDAPRSTNTRIAL